MLLLEGVVMMRDLGRLLNPRSIAVIGGGAWCASILGAARRIGFEGEIFPVHPAGKVIAGQQAYRQIEDWPGRIDAAFVGINRHASVDMIGRLAALGAGGAVCFASGFTEALAEDSQGADLQAALIAAAGQMPILGPNCYGFVNALDRAAIWPDQHGMEHVARGVAIVTQSSNIAINLTMQQRALPLAMMVTCGNMAQTSQAQIATALLDDDRITAIGLHIEGFGDLRDWEALADKAHRRGVPLVALKVGVSDQARRATISHTASLAGSDAGAQALLDRLGIARLHDLPAFLETLKLLHVTGPLPSSRISAISCSGGEASLIADLATRHDTTFPPLTPAQKTTLTDALGPMVALANPLDYHTYIWRDTAAMARAWAGMTGPDIALTLSMVDYPTTDAADWQCATDAALAVRADTGRPFAVLATLPELMPPDIAQRLMQGGVVPMYGMQEALAAVSAAAQVSAPQAQPLTQPTAPGTGADVVLSEAKAKAALATFGLRVPASCSAEGAAGIARAARDLTGPLVLKGLGLAHKSEHGAVRLDLRAEQIEAAAGQIATSAFLVEEMITDPLAELLIGVSHDPAHGFVLTLAAGGVLTEILRDSASLLVPSGRDQVCDALTSLRCAPLLQGYRGKPAADIEAVLDAVDAVQAYVIANADHLAEVEINPLICRQGDAVAVDALIRHYQEEPTT